MFDEFLKDKFARLVTLKRLWYIN